MNEQSGERHLPHVEDIDLAHILPEDIIDHSHRERYERLRSNNPELLREIARRAYCAAHEVARESDSILFNTLDIQKIILDSVTFALDAVETALKRTNMAPFSDDGDGEAPPLST